MTDLTAAAMVARRACTAQCLTSTGTEAQHCGCTRRGRWHGALARCTVPGTAGYLPERAAEADQLVLDLAALIPAQRGRDPARA